MTEIATKVSQFFLSELLWSMTWGGHHVLIAFVIMFLFFKLLIGMRLIPTLILSLFAQLRQFLRFTRIHINSPMLYFYFSAVCRQDTIAP